ncbi:MAG: hypothetical protein R3208_09390 [Ketobacteraceae bacterium]|nr:hypothetical protein [Ketobacteraceae bacterium]
MQIPENGLTNHEVTICLQGGAILGPYHATWSKDSSSDVRELSKDYESFLKGESQKRFKYHLHDTYTNSVHCLILKFEDVTGIYDNVKLRG